MCDHVFFIQFKSYMKRRKSILSISFIKSSIFYNIFPIEISFVSRCKKRKDLAYSLFTNTYFTYLILRLLKKSDGSLVV